MVVAAHFLLGTGALDVGTVAEVGLVLVLASLIGAFVTAGALNAEGLVHAAEGGADVFEFIVDVAGDFGESDDESEDGDGGDEDEFSGDDETVFVVVEGLERVNHDVAPFHFLVVFCWLRQVVLTVVRTVVWCSMEGVKASGMPGVGKSFRKLN